MIMEAIISVLFWLLIIGLILRVILGRKGKYLGWLQKQLPMWEGKNLLTRQQGDAILASYNLKRIDASKKMDTVKVLTLIGAIFIGVGIIFLVASNWQEIPQMVRTVMILAVTIGTLYTGYYFSYEKADYPQLGKSLLLLASLFWGGSIALIAQIYNIPASKNWYILLLWSFPILPLAYFFENEYIFILSSVLFLIWNFAFSVSNNVANYYYPVIVFLILIPLGYKFKSREFINVVGLIIAAAYCIFTKYEYVTLLISLGLLLYFIFWRKGEESYLVACTLGFLSWLLAFFVTRETVPNFYFMVPLIILFYLSYLYRSRLVLGLTLTSTLIWLNLIIAAFMKIYHHDYSIIAFAVLHSLLGAVIYIAGMLHQENDKEYAVIYKGAGFTISFVSMFMLAFKEIFDSTRNNPQSCLYFSSFGTLLVFFILLIILAFKGYLRPKRARLELGGLSLVLIVSIIILLNPGQALINTIAANMVLIAFAILAILLGVEEQEPILFNIGIAIFVLFIITRYIDIFWKLKEKSVFFIVSGIILVFGGMYLEKKRRQIVERMKISE